MNNLKIGIVGCGISGLYSAHLLEQKGYNVTLFDGGNVNGNIQSYNIDGECYPVSTLFIMPDDKLLKSELKRLNIKTNRVSHPSIIFSTTIFLICFIVYIINKKYSTIVILFILLLTYLLIYKISCNIILSFGGDCNCENWYKIMKIHYLFSFNGLSIPLNCGFNKLADSYSLNKNIIKNMVVNIKENENKSFTLTTSDYMQYNFDKIIIACRYNDYKNIIKLPEQTRNILRDIKYFDFYTTLLKSDDLSFKNNKKLIGYRQLDTNVYILASHEPLVLKNYLFVKNFKWVMPKPSNFSKKQGLNSKLSNIYFIGAEINDNGVNYCLEYASHLVNTFF